MKTILVAAVFAAMTATAGAALAQQTAQPVPEGVSVQHGAWTAPTGMPLYVYDRDRPGHSNCNDSCAHAWPPLIAKPEAMGEGDWLALVRDDGLKQWAYKGQPLYTFRQDIPGEPGTGAARPGWRLAKPEGGSEY